jgi:hypothetical protein
VSPAQALLLLRLIDLVAFGLKTAPHIYRDYKGLSEKIRQLVEEGRDPNPAEWAELNGRVSHLSSELQELARQAAIDGEPDPRRDV